MPAKKTTILAVDDDPQVLRLLTLRLQFENYRVLTARDGQHTLELIETSVPDLILLDAIMPKVDGFTVCRRVRAFSTTPILFLTVCSQSQDKIHGLDPGADDYVTKPFNIDELLARIQALLRRSQLMTSGRASLKLTIGDLTIDYTQHLVTRAKREVPLTSIEYRLLTYLAQNAARIVTHEMVLSYVWGPEYAGESHMLHAHINRLRHKIEPDPMRPHYIRTKRGIGYMLHL